MNPVLVNIKIGIKYSVLISLFLCAFVSAAEKQAQSEYLYAQKLFDEGYFKLAAEQFERVIRDFPDIASRDEAHYKLACSHLKAGDFHNARSQFLKVAIIFPDSPRAPESLMEIGKILIKLDLPTEAARAFLRVQSFYPNSTLATESLHQSMNLYFALADSTEAEKVIDQLLAQYPHSQSSDYARLSKGKLLFERGDSRAAKIFLNKLAGKSNIDSLKAEALYLIGMIKKSEFAYQDAIQTFQMAYQHDSLGHYGILSKLEIAELYSDQGLPEISLNALTPALKLQDSDLYPDIANSAGDAYYLQGAYKQAKWYYDLSGSWLGKLKSAWVSEKLNQTREAYEIYLEIAGSNSNVSLQALFRAAQLAGISGLDAEGLKLWESPGLNSLEALDSEQSEYQIALLKFNLHSSDSPVFPMDYANRFFAKYPESPYLDELFYLQGKALEKSGNYMKSTIAYSDLIRKFPASSFADSARKALNLINSCFAKPSDLLEKMAALSSLPRGSIDTGQWAIKWGKFYLFEFKDPVKAIDKFDSIILDSGSSEVENETALFYSFESYLRLFQIAEREWDQMSIEMYGDSTFSRLKRLKRLKNRSVDLKRCSELTVQYFQTLSDIITRQRSADDLESNQLILRLEEMGLDNLSPELIEIYIKHQIQFLNYDSQSFDSSAFQLFNLAEAGIKESDKQLTKSNLAFQQLLVLDYYNNSHLKGDSSQKVPGEPIQPIELAIEIIEKYPGTQSASSSLLFLIRQDSIALKERLKYFDLFSEIYYYCESPLKLLETSAELARESGDFNKFLLARDRLERLKHWGEPDLDIISGRDFKTQFFKAMTLFNLDSLEKSKIAFNRIYNLNSEGEFASRSLYYLSQISIKNNNLKLALDQLDTLENRYPFSTEYDLATQIRPWLLFSLEMYNEAERGFSQLSINDTDQDSSFIHAVQSIRCIYRQHRLEEAFDKAKDLYKRFKEHKLIEDTKALFYLEKGNSLDKARQFEVARKQYTTILKKFPYSTWSDEAMFSKANSWIKEENFEEGILEMNQFLENYPESNKKTEAQLLLGYTFLRKNNYPDAMTALRSVWEDSSADKFWLESYQALSGIYRDLRFSEATISLNLKYIIRFPESSNIMDKKMEIGQLYLQTNRWDEAITTYRPLLNEADADREAEIQFYIGEAYEKKGDYRSAILEFLKVPVLGGTTKLDWGVTAIYRSANCYENLGDNEGATRMYKQIIRDTGETSNYGRAALKKLQELQMGESKTSP